MFDSSPIQEAHQRLTASLAEHADTGMDDATRRSALGNSVVAIDTLTRELFTLREAVLAEARRSDDEANARVDAMLAARRDGAL